jgi:hypothetical protein
MPKRTPKKNLVSQARHLYNRNQQDLDSECSEAFAAPNQQLQE